MRSQADIERVYAELDPGQRAHAIVLADYFGHSGALEYYARDHDLPSVYSPMTGAYLWGPPADDARTVIAVDEDFLRRSFDAVRVVGHFRCRYCPAWLDGLEIRLASGPKRPWAELWAELGTLLRRERQRRLLEEEEAPSRPRRSAGS